MKCFPLVRAFLTSAFFMCGLSGCMSPPEVLYDEYEYSPSIKPVQREFPVIFLKPPEGTSAAIRDDIVNALKHLPPSGLHKQHEVESYSLDGEVWSILTSDWSIYYMDKQSKKVVRSATSLCSGFPAP